MVSLSISILPKTFHKTYSNNCLKIITKQQQQQNQQHLYTTIPCEKHFSPNSNCVANISFFLSELVKKVKNKTSFTTNHHPMPLFPHLLCATGFDNFGHKYNNNGNNEVSEGIVPHTRAEQHPFLAYPDCF